MDFVSQNPNARRRNVHGEFVENAEPLEFAVWKTVKLGACKNAGEYREALAKAGCRIGDWANEILGRPEFTVSPQLADLDLVILSAGDLGFKSNTHYSDIFARAAEMGFGPCPAETGPALRLPYRDQPRDEWLRIAMEPITDAGGYRFIFAVAQDYIGLWLSGVDGDPGFVWETGDRFVFVNRK